MLKYVKLFENFLLEAEVVAQTVGVKNIKIDKNLADKIIQRVSSGEEFLKISAELDTLAAEFEAKVDAMKKEFEEKLKTAKLPTMGSLEKKKNTIQEELDTLDDTIMKEMQVVQANSLKVKDVLVKVVSVEGKATNNYKDLFNNVLEKVNGSIKKCMLDAQEANKEANKIKNTKVHLEFEKNESLVTEGIKEFIDTIKNFVKTQWAKLKANVAEYTKNTDELVALGNKIVEAK